MLLLESILQIANCPASPSPFPSSLPWIVIVSKVRVEGASDDVGSVDGEMEGLLGGSCERFVDGQSEGKVLSVVVGKVEGWRECCAVVLTSIGAKVEDCREGCAVVLTSIGAKVEGLREGCAVVLASIGAMVGSTDGCEVVGTWIGTKVEGWSEGCAAVGKWIGAKVDEGCAAVGT